MQKLEYILYVEDDIDTHKIVKNILVKYSKHVLIANNGQEGLELFDKYRPQVVITDIEMPIMNGLEMAYAIKNIDDKVRVIFTTALNEKDYLISYIKLQAQAYILKPIIVKDFKLKLEEIIENIQKQKELILKDEILQRQNRLAAMGELMGNISHQLKQPLTVISTITQALEFTLELKQEVSPEAIRKHVAQVLNQIEYLDDTITNFRDFTKTTSEDKIFVINDVITKAIDIIDTNIKSSSINIIQNLSKDIEVFGNEQALLQVVINILNNAKDELVKKDYERFIFIDLKQQQISVELSIKDNAGGIKKDIIDKIFDPYFTTKDDSNGTGLGLYMSHEIITKNLKGTIEIENQEYQYNKKSFQGAKFIIKLKN
jgi:two-component system NtrC family sensor kinase